MSLLCKYKYHFYMEAGFYSDSDKSGWLFHEVNLSHTPIPPLPLIMLSITWMGDRLLDLVGDTANAIFEWLK